MNLPPYAVRDANVLWKMPQLAVLAAPAALCPSDARSLRDLGALQSLRLSWDDVEALAALPQLRHLALSGGSAPVTAAAVAHLRHLHRLRSLNLSSRMRWAMDSPYVSEAGDRARLPGAQLSQLTSLVGLERLCLSGCTQVDDAALRVISKLCALTFLDVSVCRGLSDEALTCLEPLGALRHVDASWATSVGSRSLATLGVLTRLESLELKYCAAIDDLGAPTPLATPTPARSAHRLRVRLRRFALNFACSSARAGCAEAAQHGVGCPVRHAYSCTNR